MATINIIEDPQGRITVNQLDPTIHFLTNAAVTWVNTLSYAIKWKFPGAPGLFIEKGVTRTIKAKGSLPRTVDKKTVVRGRKGYIVSRVIPKDGGKLHTDQPTPDLDIEP